MASGATQSERPLDNVRDAISCLECEILLNERERSKVQAAVSADEERLSKIMSSAEPNLKFAQILKSDVSQNKSNIEDLQIRLHKLQDELSRLQDSVQGASSRPSPPPATVVPSQPVEEPNTGLFDVLPPLSNGQIRLYITILSGEVILVQISRSACVKCLKHEIVERGKIPEHQQPINLMFWGKALDDDDITIDKIGMLGNCLTTRSLHLVPPALSKLAAAASTKKGMAPISSDSQVQIDVFKRVAVRVNKMSECDKCPWKINTLSTNITSEQQFKDAYAEIIKAKDQIMISACKEFCDASNPQCDSSVFENLFERVSERERKDRESTTKAGGDAKAAPAVPAESSESEVQFNVDHPSRDGLMLWYCQFRDGKRTMKRFIPLNLSDAVSHRLNHAGDEILNACLHISSKDSKSQCPLSSSFSLRFDQNVVTALVAFSPTDPFKPNAEWIVERHPRWSYRFKNQYEEDVNDAEKALEAARAHERQCAKLQQKGGKGSSPVLGESSDPAQPDKASKDKIVLLEQELKAIKVKHKIEERERDRFFYLPLRVSDKLETASIQAISFSVSEAVACNMSTRSHCLKWKFDVKRMSAIADTAFEDKVREMELRREGVCFTLEKEAPLARWSYRLLKDILEPKRSDVLEAKLIAKTEAEAKLAAAEEKPLAVEDRNRLAKAAKDAKAEYKKEATKLSFVYLPQGPQSLSNDLENSFMGYIDGTGCFKKIFEGVEWEFNVKRMSATQVTKSDFFPEMELQREEVSWNRCGDGEWSGEWVSMSQKESECIEAWYFSEDENDQSDFILESFIDSNQEIQKNIKCLQFGVKRVDKDGCVMLSVCRPGVQLPGLGSGLIDPHFFVHRHVCSSFRGDILYQCAMWPQYALNRLDEDEKSMCLCKPFDRTELVWQLWLAMKSAHDFVCEKRQDRCSSKQTCDPAEICIMSGDQASKGKQCFWNCPYCLHCKNFSDMHRLVVVKIHRAVEMCVRMAGTQICDCLKREEDFEEIKHLFASYPYNQYQLCNCQGNADIGDGTPDGPHPPSSDEESDTDDDGSDEDATQLSAASTVPVPGCKFPYICKWAKQLGELHKGTKVRSMPWFATKVKRWPLLDGPDQVCKLFCNCYTPKVGFHRYFLFHIDTANLCNAILNCRQFETTWFSEKHWKVVSEQVDKVRTFRNKSLGHTTNMVLNCEDFQKHAKEVFEFVKSFALSIFEPEDFFSIKDKLSKLNASELAEFRIEFMKYAPKDAAGDIVDRQFLQRARNCFFRKQMQVLEEQKGFGNIGSLSQRIAAANAALVGSSGASLQILIEEAERILEIINEQKCLNDFEQQVHRKFHIPSLPRPAEASGTVLPNSV